MTTTTKTMPMTSLGKIKPQIGEIWLAKCFFVDKSDVYKFRPMLIIGQIKEEFLAIKITSSAAIPMPGDYFLRDWESEGLIRPSIARVSQVFLIEGKDFGSQTTPLGVLSRRDLAAIANILNKNNNEE